MTFPKLGHYALLVALSLTVPARAAQPSRDEPMTLDRARAICATMANGGSTTLVNCESCNTFTPSYYPGWEDCSKVDDLVRLRSEQAERQNEADRIAIHKLVVSQGSHP